MTDTPNLKAGAASGFRLGLDHCAGCGDEIRHGQASVIVAAMPSPEKGGHIEGLHYHSRCLPRPDHEVETVARAIADGLGGVDISSGLDRAGFHGQTLNLLEIARGVLRAWGPAR